MMVRRIVAAAALLCLVVPAYAQRTKTQLNSEIAVQFPDNSQFQITPLNLRNVTGDIVNSIMPTAPVVSGNLPSFNGTTGLLQDSGVPSSGGTIPAASVIFTQNGTGAVSVTFDSIFRATWVTPEMYGTTCTGADDGPTIQRAVTYAGSLRSSVRLKPCAYIVNTPIVDSIGIWLVGDNEYFSTTIDFMPSTDNQIAYRVRNAGNIVSGGGIQKVLFFSHDVTHIKTAIELEDTSGYTLEDVYIQGSFSNVWGDPTGNSIGLRTRGREFTRGNRGTLIAQRPVVISDNPNSTIDSDWLSLTNMTLVGAGHPNIEMETGVNFTHNNFDGIACVQGTYCFYNNDTTTSQISEGLTFRNFGNEQGTDGTAYNFFIHRNQPIYQVEFSGFQIWDGFRHGASLRNIQGIRFSGVMANGVSPTQCFDTDSSVHGLSWTDSTFLSCSTTAFLGQNLVQSETLNAGHVLPRWATYASSADSSVLQTGSINSNNTINAGGGISSGGSGVSGNFVARGSGSGSGQLIAQAVMGVATYTLPTNSGTLAVSASLPGVINAATGNWSCPTCATSTLNTAALTKTDDTNVTLTLGGSPSTALLNAASLTLGWTGQLAVGRGGTGLASGTSGGIPYFSGSTAMASSGVLAANALVIGGGAGVAPSTTTTGTGILAALGNNVGSAGAPVVFNGAGGTPSSITLTNGTGLPTTGLTGTLQAAQFPALTGDVTTVAGAFATTLATTQPAVHTWSLNQTFTTNINVGGTSLGLAGTHNIELFSGTTNGNAAVLALGRDGAHNASIVWNVGASSAADTMNFATFGFANPLFLDGSTLNLNALSNGTILAGTGVFTISGTTVATSSATGALKVSGGIGVAGALWTGTYVSTTPTVVATSGTSCAIKGARWFVTDNNTALSFGAVITSGGAVQTPIYCDGSVWRQGALQPANDNILSNRKYA